MRSGHVAALLVIAGCAASAVASFRHDKLTIPQNPPAPASSQTAPAPFVATVQNESEWRADRVPAKWPQFSVDPWAKPVKPVPAKQAIADAQSLSQRWDEFKLGKSRQMPSNVESGKVIEQLLAIPETSPDFPAAWALFIRARVIDREIGQYRRR